MLAPQPFFWTAFRQLVLRIRSDLELAPQMPTDGEASLRLLFTA
jgi:hypothetical protein